MGVSIYKTGQHHLAFEINNDCACVGERLNAISSPYINDLIPGNGEDNLSFA
jgi:hypothetical protein